MGVLGKDYLDLYRPLTHTKVQFGESRYWVEHNKQEFPYGTILTAILNYDAQPYLEAVQRLKDAVAAQNDGEVLTALEEVRNMFLQLPLYNAYLGGTGMLDVYLGMPQFIDDIYNELQFLEPLYFAAEDIPAIQKRYTWFLSQALDDGGQRRKKGPAENSAGRSDTDELDGCLRQWRQSGRRPPCGCTQCADAVCCPGN